MPQESGRGDYTVLNSTDRVNNEIICGKSTFEQFQKNMFKANTLKRIVDGTRKLYENYEHSLNTKNDFKMKYNNR